MRRLFAAGVLCTTAFSAQAFVPSPEDMDRSTCFAMARAYGYLYESQKAGVPQAEVESRLAQMGASAGMDKGRLDALIAQSVGLAYMMPSLMSATPKEAMDKAADRCPKYPEKYAPR